MSRVESEDEWRSILSEEEYNILWGKGTEAAYSGEYDCFYPPSGYFACRACGHPLYSAVAKFKSGCGWPSFDECFEALEMRVDESYGLKRVEITCANCAGHIGHLFLGEGLTEKDERHCANSLSLSYIKNDCF